MLFTSRLLPTNCLGLLDHFVGFMLKGLKYVKESHQKNNYPAQKMIKENENEQNRMNYRTYTMVLQKLAISTPWLSVNSDLIYRFPLENQFLKWYLFFRSEKRFEKRNIKKYQYKEKKRLEGFLCFSNGLFIMLVTLYIVILDWLYGEKLMKMT